MPVAVYLKTSDFSDGAPRARATAALDELIAGAASMATANSTPVSLGPAPLSARMVTR